jgi:hypothetical protein
MPPTSTKSVPQKAAAYAIPTAPTGTSSPVLLICRVRARGLMNGGFSGALFFIRARRAPRPRRPPQQRQQPRSRDA